MCTMCLCVCTWNWRPHSSSKMSEYYLIPLSLWNRSESPKIDLLFSNGPHVRGRIWKVWNLCCLKNRGWHMMNVAEQGLHHRNRLKFLFSIRNQTSWQKSHVLCPVRRTGANLDPEPSSTVSASFCGELLCTSYFLCANSCPEFASCFASRANISEVTSKAEQTEVTLWWLTCFSCHHCFLPQREVFGIVSPDSHVFLPDCIWSLLLLLSPPGS